MVTFFTFRCVQVWMINFMLTTFLGVILGNFLLQSNKTPNNQPSNVFTFSLLLFLFLLLFKVQLICTGGSVLYSSETEALVGASDQLYYMHFRRERKNVLRSTFADYCPFSWHSKNTKCLPPDSSC